ncbi:MAG: divergent polysaccharide deacetylase family protein [Deferribacterales bacterium]
MAKKVNRTRKNKNILPALVVGSIFFLILSIIFVLLVNGKVKDLKNKTLENHLRIDQKELSRDILLVNNLDEKIKVFLFDHEISKDRLKSEDVSKKGDVLFYRYRLILHEMETYSILSALKSFFKNNKFEVIDNGDNIVFERDKVVVEIKLDVLDDEKFGKKTEPKETIGDSKKEDVVRSDQINKKVYKHKLAIILDDSGQNIDLAKKVFNSPYPITLSVLPYTQYDAETVKLAKSKGKEVFLHLPMEPKSYPDTNPGKGAILLNMPLSVIEATIKSNFERLGDVVDGVNNHMGSSFTENKEKMLEALNVIKKYTNIFVDSHTTADSVAYEVCKNIEGLKCGINKRFIDNSAEQRYIENKLYEAIKFLESGDVIIIGHLRTNTVNVLLKKLPELESRGVKIAKISEVVK